LLDYLEGLNECRSVETVWTHHLAAMEEFGFQRVFYGFTRARNGASFGDREDIMLLSNHSEEYMRGFIDEGLYDDAPMVKWAVDNVGPASWGAIIGDLHALSDSERKVIEFNIAHQVTAGYSISFNDISWRAKGAVGLVSSPAMTQQETDEMWAVHGRDIVQMNNVAHLKLASLPFSSRKRNLTKRQREVLEWVADGKTIQDIATIMGLTGATVEKHLRLAREALDAETTAQAVLKASFHNQMFIIAS